MIGSRERILASIRSSRSTSDVALQYQVSGIEYSDKTSQFREVLSGIGGMVVEISSEEEIRKYIHFQHSTGKKVIEVTESSPFDFKKNDLYTIDVAVIHGSIAVAENGAIWVSEKQMGDRLLPFSCKELVIVIQEQDILNNMQEAYNVLDVASDGYGVFIAGPSKTADIEQSLVIGAHGPIELLVYIKKSQ